MTEPIDDETLRAYLAERLPGETLARIENALRDSSELRARLEAVRQNRADPDLHSLGAIWRRARLSCPTRQQLGSYLLDALDPAYANYLGFHLDVIDCPFCRANLADLRGKADHATPGHARLERIYQSSQHLLSSDD